jgi:hypothetical protein
MISLNDINISERYTLHGIEFYTKGDLKGYIYALMEDKQTGYDHEVLYRVFDPENGNNYTLVTIDYGWKCNDNPMFDLIEKALTETAEKNMLVFQIVEKITEHVYGTTGYSKLRYDNTDHEINWSLSEDGQWNFNTDNSTLIAAFNATF